MGAWVRPQLAALVADIQLGCQASIGTPFKDSNQGLALLAPAARVQQRQRCLRP